ncbi:TPA_asm: P0 protein [Celmisia lyallii enamovirus]|uniref:P0 protein n=1 Tax=Celmisia lyallii enamovirus TaxID=2885090 RepID=A0AAD2KQW8_9VIRU|nr:TPA_asm: P0 protein [Celmisia lyallii enamovirus]
MLNQPCQIPNLNPQVPFFSRLFLNVFFINCENFLSIHQHECHNPLCSAPWIILFTISCVCGSHCYSRARAGSSFLGLNHAGRLTINCDRTAFIKWSGLAARFGLALRLRDRYEERRGNVSNERFIFHLGEICLLEEPVDWLLGSRGVRLLCSMELDDGQFVLASWYNLPDLNRLDVLFDQFSNYGLEHGLRNFGVVFSDSTGVDGFFSRKCHLCLPSINALADLAYGYNETQIDRECFSAFKALFPNCFVEFLRYLGEDPNDSDSDDDEFDVMDHFAAIAIVDNNNPQENLQLPLPNED